MTSASDFKGSSSYNKEQFRKVLRVLNQIVDYLEKFEYHYEKKFNFSKLIELLNIPKSEVDEIVSLFLNIQDIFENVFNKYRLKKYRAGNQIYLTAEKKVECETHQVPEIITISPSHIKLLNDIIYMFKHVKKGKGFDIVRNGSELLAKVKDLKEAHPYLFESWGNGVVYPSKLGLELGEIVISYNKSNKDLDTVQINNHTIKVVKDG